MTTAPVITTANTRLRPHRMSDFDAFWAFYQTPRAQHLSVPANKSHCWYGFVSDTGSWALNGHGGWAVETHDGELAGQVAITQPPHFPELEIGWLMLDGFEGRGMAYQAADAARTWAFRSLGIDTLVSYIDPANQRSIALAERLGASHDPKAALPDGETPDETVVFRHPRPNGGLA